VTDQELPEVPLDRVPEDPVEWIRTTGKITWRKVGGRHKCDDCLWLIIDHVRGRPNVTRPPGLARLAEWRRTQEGTETFHCTAHHDSRTKRGA
jgi:hypothetical protein